MSQTGIIFDVKRFAVHDGPGIRTTVFFKGCPLACQWCHNPESRHLHPERLPQNGYHRCARWLRTEAPDIVGKEVTAARCIEEIERDIVFYDQSGGGATFSGGEPLVQPDFLIALLRGCRERGIHTAVDTSGHAAWTIFESILPWTNLFLFDVKLVDEEEHRSTTGVGNSLILDNLSKLHASGAEIFVRVPLIPGITDTASNLEAIRDLLRDLEGIREVHVLPYNAIANDKYRRLGKSSPLGPRKRQSPEELEAIRGLFEDRNLTVTIGG